MQTYRSILRRQLDERLGGPGPIIGERPLDGWVRTIRQAIGMSGPELAQRMSISSSRASRIEQAEVDDAVLLSTLRRAAAALNCRLVYFLVPDEPLEYMVLRQAYLKASEELATYSSVASESGSPVTEAESEEWLEMRTLQLVDHGGLWRQAPAQGKATWTRDDMTIDSALPWFGNGRRGQGRPEADGVQP
jgi:predicted DNA-binding mobile mystery protein A